MYCPVADCADGKVSGDIVKLKVDNAKQVLCYRNIPFAKPPTGKLRFMAPQMANLWEGVRDGSTLSKIPFQPLEFPKAEEKQFPMKRSPGEDEDMDEDCLYLTIYTTTLDRNTNLPVMVWFYGGSFQDGSEKLYDGSALAGINDVVVVIPNYRLNVFGFLSLGQDSLCPGNAGLLDQMMALKWVQRNVKYFGGNPDNVTIFGESAGGMAVNHHVNSPMSRGLFHRAISHSGQANSHVYFAKKPAEGKKKLLEFLGIKETNEAALLQILQNIPASELHRAHKHFGYDELLFLPCVDGKFLVKSPEESLRDRDFDRVPYMIGCNNTEGMGIMSSSIYGKEFENKELSEEEFTEYLYFPVKDGDLKEWREFYNEKNLLKLFGRVIGDVIFVVPAVTTASFYAENSDVYFYYGSFQLRFHHDDDFGPKEARKPSWCFCDHGDDVYMMLGMPFTPGNLRNMAVFSKEEEELSQKCMKFITNFARYGNPNNKTTGTGIEWPKYSKKGKYLILDHAPNIGSDLAVKEIDYWTTYANRT
ncbi:pyrethroid hydrolase Ces2e-like isoform X1 [Styela clava]